MFKNMDIIELFFMEPSREFNVREVARKVKISPATASKDLAHFAKITVIKERRERMLKLYKANIESDLYRDMKVFYNIRKIRDSGLINELNRLYLKPAIVLFGSAAHGMDTETSDIDIAAISERAVADKGMTQFEKKLGRKLHIFAVRSVSDLRNEHLIANVLNGIVLQGEISWT